MQKTFSRAVFAALPYLCLPWAAQAADAGGKLETIFIIGQKNVPITIQPRGLATSLGRKEFDGINATHVEDFLKYAPDVFVRKRYIGDNNGVPGFRGTHSTQSARVLVLLDGFVISNFLGNSFSFPPKWGLAGPGEVAQFDVVYGPYSARHLGNSMGGVISITTRDPQKTEAFATIQGFYQPYKQYGTHEDLTGGVFETGFGLKPEGSPWSLRMSFRHLRNEGQPMQFRSLTAATGNAPATTVTGAVHDAAQGRINNNAGYVFAADSTDDSEHNQLRAKAGYDLPDGGKLQALFVYWWNTADTRNPATYLRDANGNPVWQGRVRLNGVVYNANGVIQSIAQRQEYLAGLKYAGDLAGWAVNLNLSTFQTAQALTRQSNDYATGIANGAGQATNNGPTGWYSADLKLERDFGPHTFALGGNVNLYQTDQTVAATTQWLSRTNPLFSTETYGKTQLLGAYAENEWHFSPHGSLTFGARVDNWRAFDGGLGRLALGARVYQSYAARNDTAISPSASIQGEIAENLHAQLSFAKATRFPTVGELFQGSLNGDGSFNVNSFDPNLRPEHSTDLNFILRRDFGRMSVTGSLFAQWLRDAIFSYVGFNQNGVSNSAFKNIDRMRQYGAELIVEGRDALPGLDWDANIAYIDSHPTRNNADPASIGVQFPRIPFWRLNGNLRYRATDDVKLSLGWRYASRPNSDIDGKYRGDTWGYTSELFSLDARASWQVNPHAKISLGVDNITNDRAWVFHPYPQRTFVLELNLNM